MLVSSSYPQYFRELCINLTVTEFSLSRLFLGFPQRDSSGSVRKGRIEALQGWRNDLARPCNRACRMAHEFVRSRESNKVRDGRDDFGYSRNSKQESVL